MYNVYKISNFCTHKKIFLTFVEIFFKIMSKEKKETKEKRADLPAEGDIRKTFIIKEVCNLVTNRAM